MEYQLLKKIVTEFLSYYEIGYAEEQIQKLNIFLNLLSKWNTIKRLVGRFSEVEILIDLILDSILPVLWLKGKKGLVDIGSGAGIPGVPIKIFLPEVRLYMVEPIGKKVSFLREAQRRCRLQDLIILKARIEEVADKIQCADTAISRALGDIESTITLLDRAKLKIRYLICYGRKGPSKEGKTSFGRLAVREILNYTLPHGRSRCLILLEDVCYGTTLDLPEGLGQKGM